MSLAGGTLSPNRSLPRSSATFGNQVVSPQPSTSSNKGNAPEQSNGNGTTLHKSIPRTQRSQKSSTLPSGPEGDETTWGSNFWVTLVDPQVSFSVISYGVFVNLTDNTDPDFILRLSCHWSSKLGSACRQLCVRQLLLHDPLNFDIT